MERSQSKARSLPLPGSGAGKTDLGLGRFTIFTKTDLKIVAWNFGRLFCSLKSFKSGGMWWLVISSYCDLLCRFFTDHWRQACIQVATPCKWKSSRFWYQILPANQGECLACSHSKFRKFTAQESVADGIAVTTPAPASTSWYPQPPISTSWASKKDQSNYHRKHWIGKVRDWFSWMAHLVSSSHGQIILKRWSIWKECDSYHVPSLP